MTTAVPPAAVAVIQAAITDAERVGADVAETVAIYLASSGYAITPHDTYRAAWWHWLMTAVAVATVIAAVWIGT